MRKRIIVVVGLLIVAGLAILKWSQPQPSPQDQVMYGGFNDSRAVKDAEPLIEESATPIVTVSVTNRVWKMEFGLSASFNDKQTFSKPQTNSDSSTIIPDPEPAWVKEARKTAQK